MTTDENMDRAGEPNPMKTQMTPVTAQHTPDTGDIATDAIADAGYWKGEARKLRSELAGADANYAAIRRHNAALVEILKDLVSADDAICENVGTKSDQTMMRIAAIDQARAAIARAKGQS